MKRPIISAALMALVVCLNPAAVLAEKLPKDAKPIDPKVVIKHFNGTATEWKSGDLAYWGKGGEYQHLTADGVWYGLGKWYVTTKGGICYEAAWYRLDKSEKTDRRKPICWNHVVDSQGQIWEESSRDPGDWYRFTGKNEVKGSKHAAKLKKIRKSLGL